MKSTLGITKISQVFRFSVNSTVFLLEMLLEQFELCFRGEIFIPHHQTLSCHSETHSGMTLKLCDFLFLPFGHIMTKF